MSFVQVCQLCFHCSCTALLSGLCFFLSQSHPMSLSSMKLIILSVLKRLVFCSALSGRLFLIHSVALLLYGVFKVNLFKYFSSCYQAWRLVFWACSTGSWHWQEMSNIADCHEHVKDWRQENGTKRKTESQERMVTNLWVDSSWVWLHEIKELVVPYCPHIQLPWKQQPQNTRVNRTSLHCKPDYLKKRTHNSKSELWNCVFCKLMLTQ